MVEITKKETISIAITINMKEVAKTISITLSQITMRGKVAIKEIDIIKTIIIKTHTRGNRRIKKRKIITIKAVADISIQNHISIPKIREIKLVTEIKAIKITMVVKGIVIICNNCNIKKSSSRTIIIIKEGIRTNMVVKTNTKMISMSKGITITNSIKRRGKQSIISIEVMIERKQGSKNIINNQRDNRIKITITRKIISIRAALPIVLGELCL